MLFHKSISKKLSNVAFSPGIRWLHHRSDNGWQHYLCFRQYHASPWAFTGEFLLQWPWPVHIFVFFLEKQENSDLRSEVV